MIRECLIRRATIWLRLTIRWNEPEMKCSDNVENADNVRSEPLDERLGNLDYIRLYGYNCAYLT